MKQVTAMILSSDLEAQKRDPEECEKKLEQTLTQEAEKQDQTLPVNLEIASSRKEYEERQERRMATMDDLDTKNTAEIAELTLELSQHQTQMEELTRITITITPLPLRALLDTARQKVLELLGVGCWDDIRNNRTFEELAGHIHTHLNNQPSQSDIRLLCAFNNVRQAGNIPLAHTATIDEMRTEVQDSGERESLEALFFFTFGEEV